MAAREHPATPRASGASRPHDSASASRCFVAIFPDPAAGEQLDALALSVQKDHVGSRRMQRDQLHLTLAFIGPLVQERAEQVARMLDAMPGDPFFWTIDRVGGFERARVLWAGGESEPRLITLARIVRLRLDADAVNYDRKPFSAHVTLLRHITHVSAFLLDAPILWQVTRPRLVVSERSVQGQMQYRCWDEQRLR